MATPIFDRYGGFGTVSKVVLEFYDRVGDSEILAPYFENTDMRTLIDHQTKFVASLMGGPVSYSDETIRRVHAHLAITQAAFEEMRSILEETLEDFDFAEVDVQAVIREITLRRALIVTT